MGEVFIKHMMAKEFGQQSATKPQKQFFWGDNGMAC